MHIVPSQEHETKKVPQTRKEDIKTFTVTFFSPLGSKNMIVFNHSSFCLHVFQIFHSELGIC